jgi:hypothetical protein
MVHDEPVETEATALSLTKRGIRDRQQRMRTTDLQEILPGKEKRDTQGGLADSSRENEHTRYTEHVEEESLRARPSHCYRKESLRAR